MNIGVVLHPYSERHPAGLGRYALELTKSLSEACGKRHQVTVFVKGNPPAPEFLRAEDRWAPLGRGPLWLEGTARAEMDVVMYNTPRMPFFRKPKKAVVIALDFAYLLMPSTSWKQRCIEKVVRGIHRRSLKSADHIIAISEATKEDTVRLFGISTEKISVVYPGFTDISKIPEIPVAVPERFFLFVGVVKERKNVLRAVQAFEIFSRTRSDVSFVIVGDARGAYGELVRDFIATHSLGDRVVILNAVPDGVLAFLYRRAEALVFPSLVEGFGFPVLEAMASGLPVITSKQSSLQELGGESSAILVDPKSSQEIADAMIASTSSIATKSALIAKGKERAKNFSWEKSARETLAIIEKIA